MKLGHWMQAWRQLSDGDAGDVGGEHPLEAVRTNAAATLRHVLTLLPTHASGGQEPEFGEQPERLERLLATAEQCGATLRTPYLEHSAGQMRLLWRSVRERRLTPDTAALEAMHGCVRYLLDHLTAERDFPRQAQEMDEWNAAYQAMMTGQESEVVERTAAPAEDPEAPAVVPAPQDPSETDAPALGPATPDPEPTVTPPAESSTPHAARSAGSGPHVLASPMLATSAPACAATGTADAAGLDADELERLLRAHRGRAGVPRASE